MIILPYIKDNRFILGLGIGILISAFLLSFNPNKNVSKLDVEKKARNMGMMYPEEIKAFFNNK